MAPKKKRTRRGLAITTGRPTAASAAAASVSKPPVASRTMRVGVSVWSRSTRVVIPSRSLATVQDSAGSIRATVELALGYVDTGEAVRVHVSFLRGGVIVHTRPCRMRASRPWQLYGF